jgi:hypothetical protein
VWLSELSEERGGEHLDVVVNGHGLVAGIEVKPAPGIVFGGECGSEGDEGVIAGNGYGGIGHRSQAARMHC